MLELNERQPIVPAGFLSARDSFVADTAVKIEHLRNTVLRLEREADQMRALVSELTDSVEQIHRVHAFQQSERRSKESRLDEALRCWKDLKAKVDKVIGAPTVSGDGGEVTLQSISAKLSAAIDRQNKSESIRATRWNFALSGVCAIGVVAAAGWLIFG